MSKHETMGDSLRAMAARVDAMQKEMAKLEQMSAYYSMMVVSLQKVTDALSGSFDVADGEAHVGPEIREAASILLHAAPPLRVWAEEMLETWKKPAAGPRKRRGSK